MKHILKFQINRSGASKVPTDFIDFFKKIVYFPSLGAFRNFDFFIIYKFTKKWVKNPPKDGKYTIFSKKSMKSVGTFVAPLRLI